MVNNDKWTIRDDLRLMTTIQTYGAYHIGSAVHLTEKQMQRLIDLFNQPPTKAAAVLEGRRSVSVQHLSGIGSVVVKYYTRGGLIQRLIKHRYLKWGPTRGQLEFDLLKQVRELGINAPEPVAQAHRGRLFYLSWLVTRAIPLPQTLARLSLQDAAQAREAITSTVTQISLLIQNQILHPDLHPGNVVLDEAGKVYLLDFDKGHAFRGSKQKLKNRYIARWQRAVGKHGLPGMLSDMLRTGLEDIQA